MNKRKKQIRMEICPRCMRQACTIHFAKTKTGKYVVNLISCFMCNTVHYIENGKVKLIHTEYFLK